MGAVSAEENSEDVKPEVPVVSASAAPDGQMNIRVKSADGNEGTLYILFVEVFSN